MILQNSIGPSFSLGRLHKNELISSQVQMLSPMGVVLFDELAESLFCDFALAFDRLANHLHSISTQILRTVFLSFLARCHLGPCCSSS